MATTQKLPSGSWRCRVMVGGKQKSFTAPSKKEAERKAYAYLDAHPHATARNADRLTFRQAARAYIDTVEPVLSPSTVRSYESIHAHHFAALRDVQLRRITSQMIQAEISRQAAKLSAKTVKNNLAFFSAVLKFHGEQMPPDLILPQQKKSAEIVIPTEAEMRQIVAAAEKSKIQLAVICAAYMGMTRSEICGIRLPGDYHDGRLWISKDEVETRDKRWVLGKPKTKHRERSLKVPAAAARLIEKKIASGEERLVDCNPDALYDRFVRMLSRLDLSHHVRFHDLRHFFASEMAALGIPKRYAKDLMGHADGKMLDRVYEHTISEYMDRFEDQIAEHFGKVDTK